MTFGIAGAESNVAIGVRRLGHSVRWIGRVGSDAVGTSVLRELRAEGIDLDGVIVDETAPTGIMIKVHRSSSMSSVTYVRRSSAGSRLSPDDVRPELLSGARVLHLTGITPALSDSALRAAMRALDLARDCGAFVSFDVNYRSALWPPARAVEVLRRLIMLTDIVFASEIEAQVVTGISTPEEAVVRLAELAGGAAVLKLGKRGCIAWIDGVLLHQPAFPVPVVDPIGAGDAFVAGYLTAALDGHTPAERLRTATVTGALAVSVAGDWEGLPTPAEIVAFEHQVDPVQR